MSLKALHEIHGLSIRVGMIALVFFSLVGSSLPSPAFAQDGAKEEEKELPPLDPQDLVLETRDTLQLKITYFASRLEKDAVPVVMLHQHKGSRKDLEPAAAYLQSLGHAVVTVDLRGHGDSTRFATGSATLTAKTLKPADFTNMALQDLRTVKSFLLKENNAGRLNIEKLCLVGAEMGASVAAYFTVLDWSRPQFSGAVKQGRDVRSLVLISPQYAYRGLPMTSLLTTKELPEVAKTMHEELSIMMIVGKGKSSAISATKRMERSLKVLHKGKGAGEGRSLFFREWQLDTPLQGVELLGIKSLGVQPDIGHFIKIRAAKMPYPWTDRTNKLNR